MTDHDLRTLLRDQVADVTTTADLSAGVWRTSHGARRRRSIGVVAGAAAATALVFGGLAIIDSQPSGPPGPAPAPAGPVSPDATYEGVPVWWSPDQNQELELEPVADSPLPERLGPFTAMTMSATLRGPAIAAFGERQNVYLHGRDGGARLLDVSHLRKVTKESGYRLSPLGDSMLSPSGEYLVFPQDGSLEVYAVAGDDWHTIDTGDALTAYVTWVDDRTLVLPRGPFGASGPTVSVDGSPGAPVAIGVPDPGIDASAAQSYGRWRTDGSSTAQSWGMGVLLPIRDQGTASYLSGPEFLAATTEAGPQVLAFMDLASDGQSSRYKECCPVAGWLDETTVVYQSRQTTPVLVAWTVGTDQFRLVARLDEGYDVASFADFSE
jgi:hypothetical protein